MEQVGYMVPQGSQPYGSVARYSLMQGDVSMNTNEMYVDPMDTRRV
jgi:hypothetical protein